MTNIQPILYILLSFVGLYVLYMICLYTFQHALMFPGARTLHGIEPPDLPEGAERFWVDVDDKPVEGWFLPPENHHQEKPPLVIFAHGNAELIDFFKDRFQVFRENGLAVALVGYPGFGRSKGSPSERTITETFTNAYDLLIARDDVDRDNVILIGRSMGGGAVCLLADRRPSSALVLVSTYQSMLAMSRRYLAPDFLVQSPLDNISVVRKYPNPVLVLHGPDDRVIPYAHGVALHEAAKNGTLWTYENVAHVDCPPNWDDFCERVLEYFKERSIIQD
jgi:pimeloyl-ACP methyl ester carboxylesterase